jgi:serine protease Do
VASALGLEKGQRGAIVVEVIAGGPAARAGLKPTDVVVEWDGEPIDGRAALSLLVARSPINARVRVIVLRDRQRVPLEVAVGERPG